MIFLLSMGKRTREQARKKQFRLVSNPTKAVIRISFTQKEYSVAIPNALEVYRIKFHSMERQ